MRVRPEAWVLVCDSFALPPNPRWKINEPESHDVVNSIPLLAKVCGPFFLINTAAPPQVGSRTGVHPVDGGFPAPAVFVAASVLSRSARAHNPSVSFLPYVELSVFAVTLVTR